ncbi:MAG: phosphatidylserine decarboxylase [Nitratiruptor sp.]|nr:phosphatidylserine decarboxylase [Nitratiruptor sp.]NPA84124.1 phosphatidylserine decarboxylase [Campylobacterota bacterium]
MGEKRSLVKGLLWSNIFSRGFGKFAAYRFPGPIQRFINRSYVRLLGLDMGEFEPAESYESLNALFTRPLSIQRPLLADDRYYISPCDGLVTEVGEVKAGKALQIKGMAYRIDDLLQGGCFLDKLRSFLNLYLSPRDYHRYHMPYSLQILRLVHIPGRLLPVNLPFLRKRANLFVENERVFLECRTRDGAIVYIVLVGALNVGQIHIVFEPRLQTNRANTRPVIFQYQELWLKKGELLGYFQMGSTILLFFQEPLEFLVEAGDRVIFTQNIAKRLTL